MKQSTKWLRWWIGSLGHVSIGGIVAKTQSWGMSPLEAPWQIWAAFAVSVLVTAIGFPWSEQE